MPQSLDEASDLHTVWCQLITVCDALGMQDMLWQEKLDESKGKMEKALQDALSSKQDNEHECQITHLAQELSRAYAEITSLQSQLDSREESIKLLQSGLAAIERRCQHAPADEDAKNSSHRAFTTQIMKSSTAHAEANSRLKVAAREALQYQERLAEQSQKIQELKIAQGVAGSRRRCVSADRCRSASEHLGGSISQESKHGTCERNTDSITNVPLQV